MGRHFDTLETRSAAERAQWLAIELPRQIAQAQGLSGYGGRLDKFDARKITRVEDLAQLPVLRKSDLGDAQKSGAPFGGLTTRAPGLVGSMTAWARENKASLEPLTGKICVLA